MEMLFPFMCAAGLTLIACMLVSLIFPKLKLMDKPHNYGLSRDPIPYSVGIVLFMIFAGLTWYFLPHDRYLIGFLIGSAFIVLTAFADDYLNLNPVFRLLVQIFAAVVIIFSDIGIHSISNPFGDPFSLDTFITNIGGFEIIWLSDLFTIFWIVLLVNTMNWLDGINGLASGVGLIGSIVLFLLSVVPEFHQIDQTPVIVMSSILFGIFIVFVCFDFYPAKMLMGDSGAMFLGFAIAVLSIYAGGKVATAFLILGFPVLDFFWVILQRMVKGNSPMYGKDGLHLHDKLRASGLSMRSVLFLIYTLSMIFGLSAIFLGSFGKFLAITVMVVIMCVMVAFTWEGKNLKVGK